MTFFSSSVMSASELLHGTSLTLHGKNNFILDSKTSWVTDWSSRESGLPRTFSLPTKSSHSFPIVAHLDWWNLLHALSRFTAQVLALEASWRMPLRIRNSAVINSDIAVVVASSSVVIFVKSSLPYSCSLWQRWEWRLKSFCASTFPIASLNCS